MNHNAENSSTAENFMRSAKAPTINAQVMAAKVAWKAMNTYSGNFTVAVKVSDSVSLVTPASHSLSKLPITALPPTKDSE